MLRFWEQDYKEDMLKSNSGLASVALAFRCLIEKYMCILIDVLRFDIILLLSIIPWVLPSRSPSHGRDEDG